MVPTQESAASFIEDAEFIWHQRFELAPGVWTPGASPVAWLCEVARLPADLSGMSVLDVGTTNAGTAFELERRGATRVVAVDIYDQDWFGVRALREFLGSSVEYARSSVYELGGCFTERFDVVIFWGVLYHLRHPLLALDNLRAVTAAFVSLESAVCDHELDEGLAGEPLARFYRGDELSADSSNWFAPNVAALTDWCGSAGFEIDWVEAWPQPGPTRAMAQLRPTIGAAEYEQVSYERPLRCSAT